MVVFAPQCAFYKTEHKFARMHWSRAVCGTSFVLTMEDSSEFNGEKLNTKRDFTGCRPNSCGAAEHLEARRRGRGAVDGEAAWGCASRRVWHCDGVPTADGAAVQGAAALHQGTRIASPLRATLTCRQYRYLFAALALCKLYQDQTVTVKKCEFQNVRNWCFPFVLEPRMLEGPRSADVGLRMTKDKGIFMSYVSDIFKTKPSPSSARIDSPKVTNWLHLTGFSLCSTLVCSVVYFINRAASVKNYQCGLSARRS